MPFSTAGNVVGSNPPSSNHAPATGFKTTPAAPRYFRRRAWCKFHKRQQTTRPNARALPWVSVLV